MTLMTLRDYQQEALDSVIKYNNNGIHRQLISLPTASGKTIVMAAVIKHYDRKVLLLAHREELLFQAHDKIKMYWPEADIGICLAGRKEYDHQIVIGSVQTCCRTSCLRRLKDNSFGILIIDEAHHTPAPTYQKIIKELGFERKTKKLMLGVTATPMRSDKKQLRNYFNGITYSKTSGELIQAGFLSPVSGRRILTSFNLDKVKTQMGDFAVGELATAVNTQDRNSFIVEKFKKYSLNRKSIAFCVDVKHCHALAESFNNQGITSKAVWGDMDKTMRKDILSEFSKSNIQVITSCGVLTEGFDEPSIQAIVMARPTKSKGLYIQMVGRGLRKHPGKEDCLVLDFTDQYNNLNAIMSLGKAIPSAKIKNERKPRVKVIRSSKINTLKDVDREFDILGIPTDLLWIDIGDDERSLTDASRNEMIISPTNNGYVIKLFENGIYRGTTPPIAQLKDCIKECEITAKQFFNIIFVDIKGTWFKSAKEQPATEKQVIILKQYNINTNKISKAEAFVEIQTIFARNSKAKRLEQENKNNSQVTHA